jgi:formyltetrahydrofolate synthetase
MPVKHIVMFGFKEEATIEDVDRVQQGLLDLVKHIEEIKGFELGVDLALESGQTHPAGKNRVISWMPTFANAADYETYNKHPAHVSFINDILKPVLLPGSRAAIQYEIPE